MQLHAGHVIYEMGSGSTLADVLPTEREYNSVKDDSVGDILKFIFALNKPTIQKVLWLKLHVLVLSSTVNIYTDTEAAILSG